MLYGKMAKQFMEEHLKKMGPPQPTEKERDAAERKNPPPPPPPQDTVPEWLAASPHYTPPTPPPKKEKPKVGPARTALEARRKGYPAVSTAEYDTDE